MKTILCYGDSLSWGIDPGTRNRLPRDKRWPGVLEAGLHGKACIIEENLNGRTTATDDDERAGRNGLSMFQTVLEMHAPLDLIMIMLGTNDLQEKYNLGAGDVAEGLHSLAKIAAKHDMDGATKAPTLLLIAPPRIIGPAGNMVDKFAGAPAKSNELASAIKFVTGPIGCKYFDAATLTEPSPIDGVHLGQSEQRALGQGLVGCVEELLK